MNIRQEIRNILLEVFLDEARPSLHFKDRVYNRLTSAVYTRPFFNYSDVEKQVDLLKKINFNPEKAYAVQIKSFPTTFVSKDPETGTPSVGNELWAVVRGNEITTIFFRMSQQRAIPVDSVDYTIKISTLHKYYNENEKNPDGTVDFKVKPKKGKGRKKIELDLPTIEIKGAKWYVDEENEEIIYTKNIKNKLSFDDLTEEILEKVINAVMA